MAWLGLSEAPVNPRSESPSRGCDLSVLAQIDRMVEFDHNRLSALLTDKASYWLSICRAQHLGRNESLHLQNNMHG